jgi:hypothetical protein
MTNRRKHSNSRSHLAVAALCLALFGCSSGHTPKNLDECLTDLAAKGATPQLVRWGYTLCKQAVDEKLAAKSQEAARCAVAHIPTTPTEVGFRLIAEQCGVNAPEHTESQNSEPR